MLKQRINHILFSNKVYNSFIKPFDKLLFPVVESEKLKKERLEKPVPFNKIPHVADLFNPEWNAILKDMSAIFSMDENDFHRKHWEFAHIIYVLNKLGYLFPENRGLAIGAGREQILYYLAYKIKKMVGIDLYQGNYLGGEDEPDIPDNPEKYAPFFYPEDHLELRRMDALNLEFEDNSFDFIFSASSIEHFGRKKEIKKAITEMFRVLKPGGLCVITTEISLNRLAKNIPNTKIFKTSEVLDLFESSQFEIEEKGIDCRIEDHYLYNWIKLPEEIIKRPHVILRFLRTIFTSFALVSKKPGDEVMKGKWKDNIEYIPFDFSNSIDVKPNKNRYKKNEEAHLNISLTNKSNFDWFTNGMSHRIAIGIKLLDEHGEIIDPAFGEIKIPETVKKGDKIHFKTTLPITINPGIYQLFFDLKREYITWFHQKGHSPCIRKIIVVQD